MNDQPGEQAARGRLEAERDVIAHPHADLEILTRHLAGGAERNPFAVVQVIGKMTAALGTLRGQLEAEPVDPSMVPDSPGLRMLREDLGLDDEEPGD